MLFISQLLLHFKICSQQQLIYSWDWNLCQLVSNQDQGLKEFSVPYLNVMNFNFQFEERSLRNNLTDLATTSVTFDWSIYYLHLFSLCLVEVSQLVYLSIIHSFCLFFIWCCFHLTFSCFYLLCLASKARTVKIPISYCYSHWYLHLGTVSSHEKSFD